MSSPSASGPFGSRASPAATHPPPGTVVGGKYRVEEMLGQGGMGVVVRATHLQLGEAVALKFLHGEIARDEIHVERFVREARAAARIRSEHVARVLDVGTLPGGEPFMVMELLVGEDLNHLSHYRGPLPVAEVVEYVGQACRAIAEAHQHGIVHRDLKPANLFLTRRADGSPLVKVLDFGISRWVDGLDQALTATGDVLGSPHFMAPEQIRDSRRTDARSDVWALGIVLHKLLTGHAPFDAPNAAGTLAKIIGDPAPHLRAERPDAPPELEAIVLRCLEKSPAERFQRVEDLASALAMPRPAVPAPAPPVASAGAPVRRLVSTIRMNAPPVVTPVFVPPRPVLPSSEITAAASTVTGQRPAPRGSRLAVASVLLTAVLGGGVAVALMGRAPRVAAGAPAVEATAAPTPAAVGTSAAGAVGTASAAGTASGPLPSPSASAGAPALAEEPAVSASAAMPLPPVPRVRPSRESAAGAARRVVKPPVTAQAPAPALQPLPKYGQD